MVTSLLNDVITAVPVAKNGSIPGELAGALIRAFQLEGERLALTDRGIRLFLPAGAMRLGKCLAVYLLSSEFRAP